MMLLIPPVSSKYFQYLDMSSSIFPGTNCSGDSGPQLDVLESVLEDAWDKLEQFENKKRSNLIFYGVRGETRETQADLILKV